MPIERVTTFLGVRVPFTKKIVEKGYSETFCDTGPFPFGALLYDSDTSRTVSVTEQNTLHVFILRSGRGGWSHSFESDFSEAQINQHKRETASPLALGLRTIYRFRE